MSRAYNYLSADNTCLTEGEWFDLSSIAPHYIMGPFVQDKRTFVKLFSDKLEKGAAAAVEHLQSRERLKLTFDTAALPHLGFLAQQGYDALGDGYFSGELLLAFEPTTGIGDVVATGIQTRTLKVLAAGATISFWIRIAVEEVKNYVP